MPIITCDISAFFKSEISVAYDLIQQKDVDVSKMSSQELCQKLKSGEYALSFSHVFDNATDEQNIEFLSYEPKI